MRQAPRAQRSEGRGDLSFGTVALYVDLFAAFFLWIESVKLLSCDAAGTGQACEDHQSCQTAKGLEAREGNGHFVFAGAAF